MRPSMHRKADYERDLVFVHRTLKRVETDKGLDETTRKKLVKAIKLIVETVESILEEGFGKRI